jgi:D-arabinose 1-dehydrogenase-like Zn-dependent alcohol dehydrogenase
MYPGVEGLSPGDRVGYVTRSVLGGGYADFTLVAAPSIIRLPEGVSTQAAATVLLQGLTALSQATLVVANQIQPGGAVAARGTNWCAAQHEGSMWAPPLTQSVSMVVWAILLYATVMYEGGATVGL